MDGFLKQSTAVDIAIGPFLDATDAVTAETALTISQADVRLKKNNGAWAQVNDNTSATHEENGWYEKELDATDTNTLGILKIAIHESGALPVWHTFIVVPANVYDSLVAGSDTLQADVTQWLGTAAATPTVAGVPEVDITHIAGSAVSTTTAQLGVNVVQISGDGTSADNLEAATDGTGYNIGNGSVVAASVTGSIGSLAAQAKTDVNAEVLDVLNVDTFAEPGQGTPAATNTIVYKLGMLFKAWRNKHTQTATEYALYGDDGSTKDQEAAVSDNGTTFERGEVATGA